MNAQRQWTAYQTDRLNRDFRLLLGRYPGRATWSTRTRGHWFIRINDVGLPRVCRPSRTHMKIVIPPTIYFPVPAQRGRYANWRDVYVDPNLRLVQSGRLIVPPRYHVDNDGSGWHYLCLHMLPADANSTVLDFIEAVRVHLATSAAA
ncbi:MAG: hypothetical protein LAO77_19715 [Acidobacteriia bacterium]|nr:hypothetical protein [Terriglobia bacterium]